MLKPNCIIVHGCPSDDSEDPSMYAGHWMPWTQRVLEKNNIKTNCPLMPTPWNPVYEEYKKVIEKFSINENSILIGHSCGSAFLVRYLGEVKQKVAKLILVAPWKLPQTSSTYEKEFYTFPINPVVKNLAKEIILFTSDDEEQMGKDSLNLFHQVLGGEIIELKSHGHYCLGDMGTEEFPELIDIVLR